MSNVIVDNAIRISPTDQVGSLSGPVAVVRDQLREWSNRRRSSSSDDGRTGRATARLDPWAADFVPPLELR